MRIYWGSKRSFVVGLDNYNHTEAINIVPPLGIMSNNQKQQHAQENEKFHDDSNAGVGKKPY